MKVVLRKHPPTAGAMFAALSQPKEGACITRLRGNVRARMVLLTPHPEPEDFQHNVPFVGSTASVVCDLLSRVGFDIEKDFLIVPISRFGAKASKASTHETMPFLQAVAEDHPKKIIVCVGLEPFGFAFASGRKTHGDTIVGSPMWMPKVEAYAFVLPNCTGFAETPEAYRDQIYLKKRIQAFGTVAEKLLSFAITKGVR